MRESTSITGLLFMCVSAVWRISATGIEYDEPPGASADDVRHLLFAVILVERSL